MQVPALHTSTADVTAGVVHSIRHPEQTALLARIPIAGRSVPLRAYWRRRSPRAGHVAGPISVLRNLAADVPVRHAKDVTVSSATRAMHAAADRAPVLRAEAEDTARAVMFRVANEIQARAPAARERLPEVHRPHLRAATWPSLFVASCAGALMMYYFDSTQGRRRRALVRDRFVHVGHVIRDDIPHRFGRRGRFVRGVARGVSHDAARLMHRNGHAYVDDETLVARVRSEVLRTARVKAGEIHCDAYEGCVTLRGQVDGEREIQRLIDATRRVDGVSAVRSYLHLPDAPPPNKAASYEYAARALPAL